MDAFDDLRNRIEANDITVGVIGLGYVGLPLCHALHAGGLRILGFDVDSSKIDCLAAGKTYLHHLGPELAKTLGASERFAATTDFSRLGEADVVIICVPTPVGQHQEPDLTYILRAAESIGATLRPGQLVILESTTYPTTTRDEMVPRMLETAAEKGNHLVCGRDFFVAYSPEREDPGRSNVSTKTIPKIVGGLDDRSTDLAVSVYEKGVQRVVRVSSAEVAESAKLLENIFRAVNIALVNEMKVILGAMNINIWEVVEAAATKPFGFMPFFPGPGLGGHCIPIDPFYLSWKAKEVGHPTRFIELAGAINTSMPDFVIRKAVLALNAVKKPVSGSRALVLGLAYKPNIDDTRESPSFELIEKLRALGAHVDYSDPFIAETRPTRHYDLGMTSQPLSAESLRSYDLVLVATNHEAFDWELIAKHSALVVDTRNALAPFADMMKDRLVLA